MDLMALKSYVLEPAMRPADNGAHCKKPNTGVNKPDH